MLQFGWLEECVWSNGAKGSTDVLHTTMCRLLWELDWCDSILHKKEHSTKIGELTDVHMLKHREASATACCVVGWRTIAR